MDKSPAFQFYPKDWLTDEKVMMMSKEERGDYIDLLCIDWLNNGIDEKIIERASDLVKSCFVKGGSRWFNNRLKKEREKQNEWREKSKLGGVASGKSRKQKNISLKGGSKMVPTKCEPNTNSSSSSSFTSFKKNLKDVYSSIFDFWNEKQIVVHRSFTGELKIKCVREINKIIKQDYSEYDILDAINNYSQILSDSTKYYFSYKWNLDEFLKRGFNKFKTDASPFTNYLRDKNALTDQDDELPILRPEDDPVFMAMQKDDWKPDER